MPELIVIHAGLTTQKDRRDKAKPKPAPVKRYAKCEECNQEMVPGGACLVTHYVFVVDGKDEELERIPNEEEGNCTDCNVAPGKYHHIGCDREKCPRCSGQAIGCDCNGEQYEDIDVVVEEDGTNPTNGVGYDQ